MLTGSMISCDFFSKPQNGNLVITLYCQSIQDSLTERTISLEQWVIDNQVELASLIYIEGLGPEYYIGDENGRIIISDVPPGTYTVHPVFMSTEHDITVQVVDEKTTARTIIIPDILIQGYLVHTGFMDANFRKALSVGIKREDILTTLEWDYQPVYTALPTMFYQDGMYTNTGVVENAEAATTLFGATTAQNFTLKHNTSEAHASLASQIISQWGDYDAVGTITTSVTDWEIFTNEVYELHDYEVARFGWVFDSNNPLVFLRQIFDRTEYTSDAYSALVAEVEEIQSDMDAEAFLSYIDEFHTMILDEGLFIPIYEN